MNILLAPNALKGSLTAPEVASALRAGLQRGYPAANFLIAPIADGGDGTVRIILDAIGGELHVCTVKGPLGEPVEAFYGILPDGKTAVFELAAASGLARIPAGKLSPMTASTYGTGELIRDALDKGCRRLILGLGGSATTDVGIGILTALGLRLLNESGYEIPASGGGLSFLHSIDDSGLDPRLGECEIILPCDVHNPLLGLHGSARVFAPQKGATPDQVLLLEANLERFANLVKEMRGVEISDMPHGGAAGGAAAGLSAFLNVNIVSGIQFMLDQIGFDAKLAKADIVVTAEGRLDVQSLEGKGPYGVALQAAKRKVPVLCVTGQAPADWDPAMFDAFYAVFPIPTAPMSLEEAQVRAGELVEFTGWQIGRMLALAEKKA